MTERIANILKYFGWVLIEVLFVSDGIEKEDLPLFHQAKVTILRPERNIISLSWIEDGRKRFVRILARRSESFECFANLLQPFGQFPYMIAFGLDELEYLPQFFNPRNLPAKPEQPVIVHWDDDKGDFHQIAFLTIPE